MSMYNEQTAKYAISNQVYNVNTSHPLIPNAQEYIFLKKYVSIHSEDRNTSKYPESNEFEIEMPEDITNITSIKLVQWTFPANYNTFSVLNSNVYLRFQITNPYNPVDSTNELWFRIFQALLASANQGQAYDFIIEDGFYNPLQMATELTNKMNAAVTSRILDYFSQQAVADPDGDWYQTIQAFKLVGGYTRFVVTYNNVSCKLWFGNRADQFSLLNEAGAATNVLSESLCASDKKHLPDASNWGLAGYLGLPRTNVSAQSSTGVVSNAGNILNNISLSPNLATYNGITVPRFYYGDVSPGDDGYWLVPLADNPVYWVECPYKINLMGEAFIYMELAGQNCIDETKPYNISVFTNTTNQTNGSVNAAFAKIPVPTTPISQWFDRDSIPYKFYYPPAERIRRLKIKLRYHNGQPVNFGVFNYSFMLEFTTMLPMILRDSKAVNYPPTSR